MVLFGRLDYSRSAAHIHLFEPLRKSTVFLISTTPVFMLDLPCNTVCSDVGNKPDTHASKGLRQISLSENGRLLPDDPAPIEAAVETLISCRGVWIREITSARSDDSPFDVSNDNYLETVFEILKTTGKQLERYLNYEIHGQTMHILDTSWR